MAGHGQALSAGAATLHPGPMGPLLPAEQGQSHRPGQAETETLDPGIGGGAGPGQGRPGPEPRGPCGEGEWGWK